jgi:hypothetical protein
MGCVERNDWHGRVSRQGRSVASREADEAAATHVLFTSRDARRAGAGDPRARWHRELSTTQRYMHLSPSAIDGAIRLLEQPILPTESLETSFWRGLSSLGRPVDGLRRIADLKPLQLEEVAGDGSRPGKTGRCAAPVRSGPLVGVTPIALVDGSEHPFAVNPDRNADAGPQHDLCKPRHTVSTVDDPFGDDVQRGELDPGGPRHGA